MIASHLWETTRAGSHGGRGYRFQNAVAAQLRVSASAGELSAQRITPGGLDDISIETRTRYFAATLSPPHRLVRRMKTKLACSTAAPSTNTGGKSP